MVASKRLLSFEQQKAKEKWHVHGSNNIFLGSIEWYQFWRKFIFIANQNSVLFDSQQLQGISQFMEQKTKERENG